MGRLLLDLVPITILSALTPWTIVGVTVLLATEGGVKKAIAFSLGWMTAIFLLGGLIAAGFDAGANESSSSAGWVQIGLQLGFGAAILVFGIGKWRRRAPAAAEPGWIKKLDGLSAPVAFLFGAFWINGFLVIPAALQIGAADVGQAQKLGALVFYTVGATAGQLSLIGYRVFAADRAGERLGRLRLWLGRNSAATVAGVLIVIGGGLLVKGTVALVQQL